MSNSNANSPQANSPRMSLVLSAIYSTTLMTAVGTSAMPPALRAVEQTFGIAPNQSGALLMIFTLPGIVLTPLLGVLADRLGRKKVLVPSLLLFALGGALAIYADTFSAIMLCRFIQGVGAAALGALNVALVGDYYSGMRRTKIMGLNNSVLSVGTAVFPVISGALAAIAWQYPFALPLFGVIAAVFVLIGIHDSDRPATHATLGEYFAAIRAALRSRELVVLLVMTLVSFALLFGPFLNYLQHSVKMLLPDGDPTVFKKIGLLVSSMSVTTAAAGIILDRLVARFTHRGLLIASCVLYAASILGFSLMPSYALLFIPAVVFGIAQACNQPNVQSLVALFAPAGERAAMMSVNRTVALLGQTLGPQLFGLVFASAGLNGVYYTGAAVALMLLLPVAFTRYHEEP
ncbi:MAG: MFS transporter [Candidatus Kapabacteria bacterium]|nr:MFS transporter [Candidatus Kapabacteria bacterium]